MFGLGKISWLGSYMMGAVFAAFIVEKLMSAFFSGAHEAVHTAVFRRGIHSGRNDGNDG